MDKNKYSLVVTSASILQIFSLVTVVLALLYILYLVVDISLYMKQKDQYEKLLERNVPEEIEMKETEEGIFQFNITLPQAVTLKKTLGHHYCFSKDHHSANFYLKLGAAVFCFGHLIHSCLLLVYQIIFITSESFYECASIVQLAIDICYPLYSFLLLFFIFKFSNVIINRYTILAHFGVMHCLSSSICFWVWTICREILEELANKKYDTEYTTSSHLEEFTVSTSLNQKGPQFLSEYFQIAPRRFTTACENADQTLKTIYTDYSPYLYPFSVEFSILVVGILYLVWQNIAMCKAEDKDDEASTMECKNPSGNKDNMESNVSVHVDCQSSNRGIFGGFIVLVFTIVSTILFFIAIYTNEGTYYSIGINRFYFDASRNWYVQRVAHRVGGHGYNPDMKEEILQRLDEDPTTSSRQIAADLHVSQWKIWSVIHRNGLHPYHYTRVQGLEDDPARRATSVNGEIGVQVNIITSLVILVSMTIACLFGYHRITKLDVNKGHHSLLDDVLLFICIPAYFLNAIFSIIPAYIYGNVLGCITIIMEILQVLLQTSFIVDGERRSSNTKELRKKKPGREMVTFLVICNVALWIMQTFEVKSHGMQDNRYDFYGKELWTILGHMCLPLMMFYRFHASVCFGDIWKYAYEPSRH
ncbi:hypothetical protein NQ318_010983 [Aromia moschata]|uniref:Uncharacterized protein n=1 Tax=Aromia moschata TaxID=1265417 RepID=A0AAV8YKD3_9CUCU|nr:hypothetical protein NQ318_010983 [Aromia moschata]